MRTLMIACTFWFWRRLIVRGLSQARDEGVISGSQFEMLDRAFNGEHIWDRDWAFLPHASTARDSSVSPPT
jgi:hypothetical protein